MRKKRFRKERMTLHKPNTKFNISIKIFAQLLCRFFSLHQETGSGRKGVAGNLPQIS